jgi:NagD protein
METDIIGGVQMGYQTVLALSGGTRLEELHNYAYTPDVIIESVAELADASCCLPEMFGTRSAADDSVPDIDEWRQMQLAR